MYQVSHWTDHSYEPRRARAKTFKFSSLEKAMQFAEGEVLACKGNRCSYEITVDKRTERPFSMVKCGFTWDVVKRYCSPKH